MNREELKIFLDKKFKEINIPIKDIIIEEIAGLYSVLVRIKCNFLTTGQLKDLIETFGVDFSGVAILYRKRNLAISLSFRKD
ncbi:MAG: hypothetical protein QXY65_02775 [Candidatus Methanomethylicaceae archaeon]